LVRCVGYKLGRSGCQHCAQRSYQGIPVAELAGLPINSTLDLASPPALLFRCAVCIFEPEAHNEEVAASGAMFWRHSCLSFLSPRMCLSFYETAASPARDKQRGNSSFMIAALPPECSILKLYRNWRCYRTRHLLYDPAPAQIQG